MNALVRPITWLFGIVFILIGIIGYMSNPILGIFAVNNLHNIVHLASGLVALYCASKGFGVSRMYLIVFGLVYAVVTVAGFLGLEPILSMLELNSADNYLHLVIAAVALVVGFGSKKM